MKTPKLNHIKIILTFILISFFSGITFAKDESENNKLGSEFLKDVIALKSQDEIPALAKQYNFVQETDPERLNFFQNKKVNGSLEILSVDGLYISLNYDTYEKACAASADMVKANLEAPKTFEYKPYWPNQALLTSRWTGQGKQSHVSLYCEQYSDEGKSDVGININFTKLEATK